MLGTLLDVLGVASFFEGLPGHVLLDIGALLPGGGAALPAGDVRAVLLVLVLGDGCGDAAADLVRDVVTDFTRSVDIIADLKDGGIKRLRRIRIDFSPAWEPGCIFCWRLWSTCAQRPPWSGFWAPGSRHAWTSAGSP